MVSRYDCNILSRLRDPMNIACKSPIVIRHKHIREYIIKSSHYVLHGTVHFLGEVEKYKLLHDDDLLRHQFPTHMFDVRLDELEDFSFVDACTGELYPIFQVCPCGHCTLCRYRKTQQWMCRAFAENCTSETPPLFLTLTYNDWCYPSCGLLREHCQLFMKRLRKRLKDYGYDCNLRFYLAAEYGKNTHRGHYHLMLWNFPYMDYREMVDYIQDAWSVIIDRTEYDLINNKDIVYIEHSRKWCLGKRSYVDIDIYRKRLGFVYLLYLKEGAASYVMKYLRKEMVVPSGCVAPFQLYSRRNGLGSQWIDDNRSFFHENPDQLDVVMYDRWTNSTYKCNLPLYFTNRLFPSRSKLLSKDLRDEFRNWSVIGNILNALRDYFGYDRIPLDNTILTKFDMLCPEPYTYYRDLKINLFTSHSDRVAKMVTGRFPYPDEIVYVYSFSNDDYTLTRIFNDLKREYLFLTDFLHNYPLDKDYYTSMMSLKLLHDGYVADMAKQRPPIDVVEFEDYLIRKMYESERKELF